MLSSPSFRSAFLFSILACINSLMLPVFLLSSFHLAEASLSAFSGLYTLYAIVQKYHERFYIFNYSHF